MNPNSDIQKFGEPKTSLTEFIDPFLKGNISQVAIFLWFPAGNVSKGITASVDFIANNTHGEQKFREPLTKEGFENVVRRVFTFIESLK